MGDTPDFVHGRLSEAIHMSGYTFERACRELKWLLEDDKWKACGTGYEDIDVFLDSLSLSQFKFPIEERKELSKLLAEKRATQRATAGLLGVSHTTVQNDLGNNLPKHAERTNTKPDTRESGNNLPPPPVVQDATRAVKDSHKSIDKKITYNHIEGDEWYTPKWLFDSLELKFSIDVCAPIELKYVHTPTKRYFNEMDDGLSQKWEGLVWCNPPYSLPEPWAIRCIEHGNGLLLTHIPMNAEWCSRVWEHCDGIRLFQAIEFIRPDGALQRPGNWLQLAAFGVKAANALSAMKVPDEVAKNPRRIPSPMWIKKS